ncbi:non-ribosomal peptide synthetase [Maribacter thermophilus]|uniref:non-ribosomal peptide synthetase n=1 Tax=Maribacter thermophilus TaxID=1197874 RepID=UPI000641253D|nr:non-ribosomal peptide synthetase [Maribacter thermophilus]
MQDIVAFNPFVGPAIEKIIPIVQAQAEVWIACKLGGEDANRAYNESVSLILKGHLNKAGLEDAIQKLVQRHEALRSTFSRDGRFMTVFEELPITPVYKDFSQLDEAEKNRSIKGYLSEDAHYIFDLVEGPLFKIGLLKLSELEHQLVLTAHHIICDGWSTGIMLEEIGSFYSAYTSGKTPDVPEPEMYSSYAEEEQEFIQSKDYIATEQYWLKQYEKSVPTVTLPTDFPRPQLRTFKSNRLDFAIDSDLVADLKKVGIKSGASFVVTLMAAFEVFLYRQTGQDDLVLGLPAAGQSLSGKTQLIGHCVNLLPLRTKIAANIPFNEYLKTRKIALFDAYEHQQFSFGQLLQKLAIARDPSRVPLVPIMFNIDMGMANAVSFDGLDYKLKSNPRAFEAFELFLNATGTEDELILEWAYNSALFSSSTIEQMMVSFKEVLHGIVANPSIEIGNIVKIDTKPYAELNNTVVSYPQLALHELLAEQAQNTPLKQAIKFGDSNISYENLEKQGHQLAHYFIEQGVAPGDYIAVSLPRSIELVVTLIAIMECGAAYLPLDPNYPSKRLEYMLEDSEAKYLITTKNLSSSLKSNSKTLLLEDIFKGLSKYPNASPNIKVDNSEVVYLLYTSGSTGKPKGVPVTHKNLVNFLFSMLQEPGIKETDKLLSITTISFDIAGLELFVPLLKGASLVLTDEETARDSRLLLEVMEDESITMMQATPTTWQMLLDAGWKKPLPIKALCGGEALPIVLAKNILERVDELWNMYGPTETTVWSAVKQISKSDDLITVGKPIANTQIYIVNEHNQLVEPGKTGELCIAGDGVAKGYWKRQDLTAEKFTKNPFESDLGPILYHTGDLAKLLPSGEVQCLGRIDQQIKIRGHRIELGEIEQALDSLDGVQSSVVLLNGDNLVANLIPAHIGDTSTEQINSWKETLREQLPPHMVPQQFNLVQEFPTTLNGKIDRKELLSLLSKKNTATSFVDPSTKSEKIIASIWQECLGIDKINVNSDFFELGGHSLIAVRVMTQLEKETGNRLPLVALLKNPTVKKLAAYMDSEFITWDSLVPLKPEGNKPPLYIVHGAHHNVFIFNDLAKQLDDDQPVYALQPKGLNGVSEPHDSIDEMAAHYVSEIIASNPEGPYALAGFSLGGIVAFEMARQLREQGKEVKILALFDSYVFPYYYYKNPFKKKVVSFLYLLGRVTFIFLNMFSSAKNFKRRVQLIKLHVSGLFLRMKIGKEKQHEMQHNRSLKMDTMHNQATDRYTIVPQDMVVDLFRAKQDIYFAHDYNLLGWKNIAKKGIRKHMVPGNHIDMFSSPNVEVFANSLQDVLDNYDTENKE